MKDRMLETIMLLLLVLSLSACGSNIKVGDESEHITDTKQGVSMTVLKSSATSATYQITNETGDEVLTGNDHSISIEVEQDSVWYQIEVERWSTDSEALVIGNEQTREMSTSWNRTYGHLPKGHYRILKGCWIDGDSREEFVLSAEFDIG